MLERTDEGSLGCGIYFASSVSTSLQYALDGYVFLSEVALGNVQVLTNSNLEYNNSNNINRNNNVIVSTSNSSSSTITTRKFPASGFDSCMGLASQGSQFSRDEYSVYRTSQQRLCYLLQFETVKPPTVDPRDHAIEDILKQLNTPGFTGSNSTSATTPPMVNKKNEKKPVEIGIRASGSGWDVVLERSEYRAKVVDMAAQVTLLQHYFNRSDVEVKAAQYVFPVDEMAAVNGFEAFVGEEKHLVAQVKEREKAREEYRQAVKEGDGAYMMELVDDDNQQDKVWAISIGNLPPKTAVVVRISYVVELHLGSDDSIQFYLPLGFKRDHQPLLSSHFGGNRFAVDDHDNITLASSSSSSSS